MSTTPFRTVLLLALLVLLTPGAAPAQEAEPEAASQPASAPQFDEEIEVRLVRVPLIARDRQGEPVTDLTPDELRVVERGEEKRIAYLEPLRDEAADAGPLPEVRLHVEAPGGGDPVALAGATEPRHMIFLVDVENDQPLGKLDAAEDLIRFATQELDDAYRVAVLSFNGHLNVEIGFSTDRRRVARAITRAFDRPPRPHMDLRRQVRGLIEKLEDCIVERKSFSRRGSPQCIQSAMREYTDEQRMRAKDFLGALEGVVRYLSALEGRKSAVVISHGTSMNVATEFAEAVRAVFGQTDDLPSLQLDLMSGEGALAERGDIIDLAIRNEVTLHFVDRTTVPTGDYGARQADPNMPGAFPMTVTHRAAQMDLQELAEHTGGVFVSDFELIEGLREVARLEEGVYHLGYYTDRYLSPEQLAKVRVETSRPGVRITHRRGTYARAEDLNIPSRLLGRIAVGRPEEPSSGEPGVHLPFQVIADPRRLGYQLQGEAAVVELSLHLQVQAADGRAAADSYHFLRHGYPAEVWLSGEEEPVIVEGWVELPPGEYRLVASLRNPAREMGGVLDRMLEVARRPSAAEGEGGGDGTGAEASAEDAPAASTGDGAGGGR